MVAINGTMHATRHYNFDFVIRAFSHGARGVMQIQLVQGRYAVESAAQSAPLKVSTAPREARQTRCEKALTSPLLWTPGTDQLIRAPHADIADLSVK